MSADLLPLPTKTGHGEGEREILDKIALQVTKD